MVATSTDVERATLGPGPDWVPPRPAGRDERELTDLMREILPEEDRPDDVAA